MDRRTPVLAVVAGLAALAPAASADPGDVVNKAEANFPTLATTATVEKIEGKDGLDLRATGADGRPVDIEELLGEDRAKQRDAVGALDRLARPPPRRPRRRRARASRDLARRARATARQAAGGRRQRGGRRQARTTPNGAACRPSRGGDDPVPGPTPTVRRAGRRVDLEPARVGQGARWFRPRAGEGRAGRHDLR